jgi:hypothetical protein
MQRTKPFFAEHGGMEFYTLVAAADPGPARPMKDLFEGMS